MVEHPEENKSYWNKLLQEKELEEKELDLLINNFQSYKSVQDLKSNFKEYYDVSIDIFNEDLKISAIDVKSLKILELDDKVRLFDNIIYNVLTKKSNVKLRENIAQLLIVNHLLEKEDLITNFPDKKISKIKVVIPQRITDIIKPIFHKQCEGELHGVINLGIADYRRVEQEVCCYVPGEVSHIENVMAREYKERSTRNLTKTEDYFESTTESQIENLTDTATTKRHQLNSEIASVLADMKSNAYTTSTGISADWGPFSLDTNFSTNSSSNNSSSLSNTDARQFAEEVTQKASDKILQKTSSKRTAKIIKEFEDQYKHGFDNRVGNEHVTGIYRWIDIIYKNNLVNYGKRLVVEFMVPEPSEFYKRMLNYKPQNIQQEEVDTPEPPKSLSDFGITTYKQINSSNVHNIASYYGVSVDNLPAMTMTLSKDLTPLRKVDHNRRITTQSLEPVAIPSDYELNTVTGAYTYEYQAGSGRSSQKAFCDFTFGGEIVHSGGDYSGTKKTKNVNINLNFPDAIVNSLPISVGYSGCLGFYGAVSFELVLKTSVQIEWKNKMYNKFLAAYNAKLDAYNQELSQIEQDNVSNEVIPTDYYTNPSKNRLIEQRELKRICIEMLMKPFCKEQGVRNYVDKDACGLYNIPQVSQTISLTNYTKNVKFFEEAIDWKLMSYMFYPYYWADKCDWGNLLEKENENDDPVFQAFLQSGMANVLVPIKYAFSEAFALYLETGDITMSNTLVSGGSDGEYLSLIEDLQTITGEVEDTWETRVPTTLTIIQGKSAYLKEEGLPCCNSEENNIISSENLLGNLIDNKE